jgi:hypothetical protein
MADKRIKRSMLPPGRIDRLHRLAQMKRAAGRRPVPRKIKAHRGVAGGNKRIGKGNHVIAARSVTMHQKHPLSSGAVRTRPEYMGGNDTAGNDKTDGFALVHPRLRQFQRLAFLVALRLGGPGAREQPERHFACPVGRLCGDKTERRTGDLFNERCHSGISRLVQL